MRKAFYLFFLLTFFNFNNIFANSTYNIYHIDENYSIVNSYKFLSSFTNEDKILYLTKKFFNCEIKGIHIENGNLYINFNNSYKYFPKGSYGEFFMLKSFFKTMSQFYNIKTVTFIENGKDFIFPAGNFVFKLNIDFFE